MPATEHSKFWLGDRADSIAQSGVIDVYELAALRRAIANFVFILTGRNVPVKFADSTMRMSDAKTVVIGGDLSATEFDSTVGQALRGGAHVLKSDHVMINTAWMHIPTELYDINTDKDSKPAVSKFITDIVRFIEDRFVDDYIYRKAPGYRGYCQAMYDKLVNSAAITEALPTEIYRNLDLDSYRFRVINISNPATDLDALPCLREIASKIDLPNIRRLENPTDRLALGYDIAATILNNTARKPNDPPPKSVPEPDGQDQAPTPSAESNELAEDAAEALERQLDFIRGTPQKNTLSTETIDQLEILDESGVDMVQVGGEMGVPRVTCVVVKRMTRRLMESDMFPYATRFGVGLVENTEAAAGVMDGIRLGQILGQKLQIRGESRITKYTRLDSGALDGRLIAEAGFGCDRLFYKITTEQYRAAHLHLSVDASGSMCEKWRPTIATAVAIAKAVSMVRNLSIVVSFRSGVSAGRIDEPKPYVVIAYDSRVDPFSKVKSLFPFLCYSGSTPEGLAFQAILDTIPAGDDRTDSYFVNLSDGEPAFHIVGKAYEGEVATKHTRHQVDKIKSANVEVLSYFIESQSGTDSERGKTNQNAFREMYGRDAQFIDVESITQVAITMNRKFLQKAEK